LKRTFYVFLLFTLLFCSCATYQPPPPSLYIDNLPQSIVSELSLDERILVEDAWKNLKQGKGDKAKKIFSRLDVKSPFYYAGLGYTYFILNEFQVAEEFFKAALKYHPDMALVHLGLAQIYQKEGLGDLAFAEFREVLKKEPEHTWVRPKYETLKNIKTQESLNDGKAFLSEEDTERSKASFLKALYYSPDSTEAHLALADIYKNENRPQNALVHLKAAISNDPQNKEILKNYAETLFQAEENKKSLEIYEKLQKLEPDNQKIRERLGTLKNRLGIFELPSQYNAIPSSESISKEEISALLGVKFKDILDEPSGKPLIIIDIATSWASKFILKMTSLGILDVYPNHNFRPKKIITRAEMAETLIRLIDHLKNKGYRFIQQIPPEKIQIIDVSPDNFYYQPIIFIISYDIMSLTMDKTFKPDFPVSGQEAIRLFDIILALIK